MSILTNKTINNFANSRNVRKFASNLCSPVSLLPVVMLEATVISGRTYQAQKRGGEIEARERLTEETLSSVTWLWGIQYINKGFDFLINKVGKIQQKTGIKDFNFDTGRDSVRQPFEYVTKGVSSANKKLVAVLKFSKIVASALMAVGFMGFVLPKINQHITKKELEKDKKGLAPTEPIKIERHKKKLATDCVEHSSKEKQGSDSKQTQKLDINEFLTMSRGSAGDPKFNGGTFFELAAHKLENDSVTQLLVQDGGLFTGRAVNARNRYERTEILFRDLVSSFFYIASTPLIYMGLCAIDKYRGKNTNLDPEIAHQLHQNINAAMGNNNSLSTEEFKKKIVGQQLVTDKVLGDAENIFEDKLATVDKMHQFIDKNVADKDLAQKLKDKTVELAKLQPKKDGKAILTKSQLQNLFHDGVLNEAKLINELINNSTDQKAMNPIKFVSQKEIDKKRKIINEYVESILQESSKKGKVTKELLEKMKNRNLLTKLGYWGAGMAVSAAFLSTIIPKIQYKITQKTTGDNKFPGIQTYKIEN